MGQFFGVPSRFMSISSFMVDYMTYTRLGKDLLKLRQVALNPVEAYLSSFPTRFSAVADTLFNRHE